MSARSDTEKTEQRNTMTKEGRKTVSVIFTMNMLTGDTGTRRILCAFRLNPVASTVLRRNGPITRMIPAYNRWNSSIAGPNARLSFENDDTIKAVFTAYRMNTTMAIQLASIRSVFRMLFTSRHRRYIFHWNERSVFI